MNSTAINNTTKDNFDRVGQLTHVPSTTSGSNSRANSLAINGIALPTLSACQAAARGEKSLSSNAGKAALYVAYGLLAQYAESLFSGKNLEEVPGLRDALAQVGTCLGALTGHDAIPVEYLLAGMIDVGLPTKDGAPLSVKMRAPSRLKNIVRDYNPTPVLVCKAMSKPRLSAGKKAPAIPEKVREMTAQERKQWAENRIATVQKQMEAILAFLDGNGAMGLNPEAV